MAADSKSGEGALYKKLLGCVLFTCATSRGDTSEIRERQREFFLNNCYSLQVCSTVTRAAAGAAGRRCLELRLCYMRKVFYCSW